MIKDEVSFSEMSLAPVAQPGSVTAAAAAKRVISFWNEARLRTAEAKSGTVRAAPGIVPWRTALEDVLKVGYGAQSESRFVGGAWELIRWRTTPSAGAIYPFEVIASVIGEATYLWDIERGLLVSCGPAPLTQDDLAEAGIATPPGHRLEALLIVVARPWLSMRKYRLRGYAYSHLDVGHTATNLAVYTTALGYTPTVHLRFSRASLSEVLKLDGLCRLPLAVLSFAGPGPAVHPEPAAGPELAALEAPDLPEILNWESLRGLVALDSSLEPLYAPAGATLVAEPPAAARQLVQLPAARSQFMSAREWRSSILARRSAKGFRDEPLTLAQVGEVLSALRVEGLPADCAPEGPARMGARLVARNVDGLAGVYAYAPESHALQRIDEEAGDPRPACMRQEIAGNAAALVIFHAPVGRLLERQGYSAFAELLFHAAQLGQRLYLATSRLGTLGITCIGGFDDEECANLARLDAGEETVYVILLGVPNEAAFKYDQLSVAFSHGYTTRED